MKYLIILKIYLITTFQVFANEADYAIEFGLVLQNEYGETTGFEKTTDIPINRSGEHSLYGLVLTSNSQEDFTLGSVHILPSETIKVSKIMGRTMTINTKGAIFMKTQAGDTPGNYEMEIYINGLLYKTIKYRLIANI